MKKTHIAAIIVIAASIAIIIATTGDASTYVNFDQAFQMSSTGNRNTIHVVGELKKDAFGNVIGLEKSPDLLSFSFILLDANKKEQRVIYNEPMPPDFTRSEKVVVVGSYQHDEFVANKILLKCPSKYNETKLRSAGI
jgi:cytochrome c-type biogenesis protein CcmE